MATLDWSVCDRCQCKCCTLRGSKACGTWLARTFCGTTYYVEKCLKFIAVKLVDAEEINDISREEVMAMKQRLYCDVCKDWRVCSTSDVALTEQTIKGEVALFGHTSHCDTCQSTVWSPVDRDYNIRVKKKAREIRGGSK